MGLISQSVYIITPQYVVVVEIQREGTVTKTIQLIDKTVLLTQCIVNHPFVLRRTAARGKNRQAHGDQDGCNADSGR